MIELPPTEGADETPIADRPRKLSVDELLASRLSPPPGVGSVSLADIENAIVEGALNANAQSARSAKPF